MIPTGRPLQVLILGLNYAPEPTGIAPYTTGIARFLADAGHDVHVITGFPHYPQWKVAPGYEGRIVREFDGAVRVSRVWHPVPDQPTGRSRITMEAVFALQAAAVVTARPDVVLAVSPSLLAVATALRWKSRGRTAVGVIAQDLYGRAVSEAKALGGHGARAVESLERSLLRRADGVVAIHESFRRSLSSLGVEDGRITTIRNWTHIGSPGGDTNALRASMGWRDDETVALHAGNMGAKQGLENVVEAARLADRRQVPVRFVLMGAGNQRRRLEALGQGVRRLQFVDPLPDRQFETAIASADALVLNERPEVEEMCVPSKLTSYFSSGRPVIAATSPRSAATAEVYVSGGGVCVAPGEPSGLLDAVLALRDDSDGREAMGQRGQAFAREILAKDAAREAYLRWVEGLAYIGDTPAIPEQRVLRPNLGAGRQHRGARLEGTWLRAGRFLNHARAQATCEAETAS